MPNLIATSSDAATAALAATQTGGSATVAGGDAVLGRSDFGNGVHGVSTSYTGVRAESKTGRAIEATSDTNFAIHAASRTFPGLRADSVDGRAIEGWGVKNDGVWGLSQSASGVHGISTGGGDGVYGEGRRGVVGISPTFQGVYGKSVQNAGVVGESDQFPGLWGVSHSPTGAGTFGTNDRGGDGLLGDSPGGVGVRGRGRIAAVFEGDVEVTGDIRLTNADCAEDFDVVDCAAVEPGMVVVIGDDGALHASDRAYDRRVAGVVSGAGAFRPALILDRHDGTGGRRPVALVGKVYCRVEADSSPIATGDLLTTSDVPGHAMRASDAARSHGTVIGKALRPLAAGRGLIPILVALQ